MPKRWKKGRGKLGPFDPLLGHWVAETHSPMGPMRCTRTMERILGNQWLRLVARWEFGPNKAYEEVAIIGPGPEGTVRFWSFTNDGKRSEGDVADVTDLHPEAVGFEAQMPAGRARMAYWPADDDGVIWVVEARTKKGWSRMAHHHYHRPEGG
jgi:WD40 repeat protein